MRVARLSVVSLWIALSLGAIALSLNCDTSTQVDYAYGASRQATADDDNDDLTPPDVTAPDPPEVDPPTSPTSLTYQSMRGTAEPNATVRVAGGLATTSARVDENGAFCVKVALRTEAENTLKFTAEDDAGNESAATTVKVVQHVGNLALDGAASAGSVSHSKPENTPDQANDGNYLTWWENTTQVWFPECLYYPQWYAVKLASPYWVNKAIAFWGRDALGKFEYATKFDVYVNTNETIEKMPHEVSSEEWADYGYVKVGGVEQAADSNVENNEFDLSADPVQVQWVFLMLYESNVRGVFTGPNGEIVYSYEVAELEIYGFEEPDDACD